MWREKRDIMKSVTTTQQRHVWLAYTINPDIIYLYSQKTLPLMCVMSGACWESVQHLLLHCSTAASVWNSLLGISGECCVCPGSLDQFFMISFNGFRRSKETKFFRQCAIYAILGWICRSRTLVSVRRFLWQNKWFWLRLGIQLPFSV